MTRIFIITQISLVAGIFAGLVAYPIATFLTEATLWLLRHPRGGNRRGG